MAIETTLADIAEAATDPDLRDRFVSAAAEHGVPNPQGWVESQMRRLVAHKTNTNGDTVASTRAYAAHARREALAAIPEEPGKNRAAVTDSTIRDVVSALYGPTEEGTP